MPNHREGKAKEEKRLLTKKKKKNSSKFWLEVISNKKWTLYVVVYTCDDCPLKYQNCFDYSTTSDQGYQKDQVPKFYGIPKIHKSLYDPANAHIKHVFFFSKLNL